jgi:hypothetical protein
VPENRLLTDGKRNIKRIGIPLPLSPIKTERRPIKTEVLFLARGLPLIY